MNINPVIAILVLRNVITQEEGQAVVDFVHDKPQSTVLSDSIDAIKELLVPVEASNPVLGPVGPVQREEEIAARTAAATAPLVPTVAETDKSAKIKTNSRPFGWKSAKPTSVKKSDAKPAKK